MGAPNTITLVLADDHRLFRDGLRRLLETEPDLSVVGEAGDAQEAVRLAQRLQPDMLLLDLAMAGGGGLEVLRTLSAAPPLKTRAIVVTARSQKAETLEALQLGARGLVLKEAAGELLIKSIRCVMRGEYWVGGGDVSTVLEAFQQQQAKPRSTKSNRFGLTPREMEIVAHVSEGASNKDIAERLKLREDTVKHHLSSVFDKLGVYSRLELALFAINHSLIDRSFPALS
jgi:two-component system, NarL family, nitrate/nitrite response regulator NarL